MGKKRLSEFKKKLREAYLQDPQGYDQWKACLYQEPDGFLQNGITVKHLVSTPKKMYSGNYSMCQQIFPKLLKICSRSPRSRNNINQFSTFFKIIYFHCPKEEVLFIVSLNATICHFLSNLFFLIFKYL